MMGQVFGNLTNIVLDSIMILTLGWNISGAAKESLITNISRQGLIYIPFMFILGAIFHETGLIWAQPVADVISFILAIVLYYRRSKKRHREIKYDAT